MAGNGKTESVSPNIVPASADPEMLLAAALKYRERGWRVMPLKRGSGDKMKQPALDGWSTNCVLRPEIRLGVKETICRWWREEHVGANLGICTGPDSGIAVLDLDGPDAEAAIAGLMIPKGPQVRTGRGRHIYFGYPSDGTIIPSINGLRPRVDVKATGGYLVGPPSIHPSGRRYEWIEGTEELPLPPIPAWLMKWITEHGNRNHTTERPGSRQAGIDENSIIPEGERNDSLFRLACSLRQKGLSEGGIEGALGAENLMRCKPPLSMNEIRVIAGQAAKYKAGEFPMPKQQNFNFGLAWNDSGMAQRLVDAHGENIRHCEMWNSWLVWDGCRWERGGRYQLTRYAGNVVAQFRSWAESLPDGDDTVEIGTRGVSETTGNAGKSPPKKAALAFAKACGSRRKISDMIALAEAGDGIPVKPDLFDRDKYLLNCANGTLDLQAGVLHPHARGDYITKVLATEYHPDAKAPLWEGFLHRIMGGNVELTGFLRRAVGYSLSGDVGEQCLFVLHGCGSNGKSTFLSVLQKLLGDYAKQAVSKTLMAKRDDTGAGFDIANLFGARLVCSVETAEHCRLDESLVKQLTGGDTVSCRRLHENFWEFRPEFKIFLATNHRPGIKGTDDGIWRRIRLIPFEIKIPESEKDPHLPEKLELESEGILAWAVRGFREWQEIGLRPPAAVMAATSEYRTEQDTLGAFFDDKCAIHAGNRIEREIFFKAYLSWCEVNRERAMSQKVFTRALRERGFNTTRTTAADRSTVRYYQGITLKNTEELDGLCSLQT